ncbi:MAG TPA: GNAT family N-acetyltransferase [Dehalococcoidia bacterium]|nr:GNAT family N-acetyltransferase [Dehalococcoidia bacterium]
MAMNGVSPAAVEEILLLCTAPVEQVAYDGWLVRTPPNDVKRASSVNAFYGSTRPLAEKIEGCEALYAKAGLPPIWRLTAFSKPSTLDGALADRGYVRFEPSLVQVSALNRPLGAPPEGLRFESMILERWLEVSGGMRGRTPEQIESEFRRLHHGEVPGYCSIAYDGDEAVACGLAMHEQEFAGLFDVFVTEEHRSRDIGTAVSAHLLTTARRMGATVGWLSVVAENVPALAAYRKLGFETLYEYWYRVRA